MNETMKICRTRFVYVCCLALMQRSFGFKGHIVTGEGSKKLINKSFSSSNSRACFRGLTVNM